SGDDVIIANEATVTIDVNTASLWSVTIGQGATGVLQSDAVASRTVTINGDVIIGNGAVFGSAAAGSTSVITGHSLIVGGGLINNGTIDFSATAGAGGTTANAAGVLITFTGGTNNDFDCTAAALT